MLAVSYAGGGFHDGIHFRASFWALDNLLRVAMQVCGGACNVGNTFLSLCLLHARPLLGALPVHPGVGLVGYLQASQNGIDMLLML